MISTIVIVKPAYGRDYKNKKEAIAAWAEGKDFIHSTAIIYGGGEYTSCRDWPDGQEVEIRYNKLRSLVLLKNVKNKC